MAKITGPLFSFTASGNLAGQIQFRGNRYGAHAYRPPRPERQNQQTPSPSQAATRRRYADIRARWWELTPPERQAWADLATMPGFLGTGWNLFLAVHMAAPECNTCDGGTPWAVHACTIDGGRPDSVHSLRWDGGTPWGTENTPGGRPWIDGRQPGTDLRGIREGGTAFSQHVRIFDGGTP